MDDKEKDKAFNPNTCFNSDDYRRFEEERAESAETVVISEKWYKSHKKAVEEYKHRLYGGKDFTFASELKTVCMPAKSTMTLDEFWEQNHMSNHTWGVTIGGRK